MWTGPAQISWLGGGPSRKAEAASGKGELGRRDPTPVRPGRDSLRLGSGAG